MPITIDTLAAQRTMEAAGIEPAHAEAIVNAFAHTGDQIATKADIQSLEQRLEVEITGVKTEVAAVKTEVAAVRESVKTEVAAVTTEITAVKASLETEVTAVKTEFTARINALETKLEAKIDSKISALGNRILAAMLAFGGLLYAALRIF